MRGSTPCPCDANGRYGGNTSCVSIEVAGEPPIVFDVGTGLRLFGLTQPADGSFRGTALLSHLHWDHVQGLPFFTPIDRPGARLDVFAPVQDDGELADVFDAFMRPPYFPVRARDLRGEIRFHAVDDGDLCVGSAKVRVRPVPHNGPTVGYRVDWDGASVAYVSDHQQPLDGTMRVPEPVLELCDGVDLLIHDAQFTPADFAEKPHWGHCTVDYALIVAREAGARALALFHHDPSRSDAAVDALLAAARRAGEAAGIEVIAAAEGRSVVCGGAGAPAAGLSGPPREGRDGAGPENA